MSLEIDKVTSEIGKWAQRNTGIVQFKDGGYAIATFEIDSFGDTIYVFVEKTEWGYRVGDDGRLLFKLDPGESNLDMYETAAEIALGAGYDFDEETCEIFVEVEEEDLAQAIMRLAQIQVAISYLG
ncbi:Putative uncharacterized protein [Lactobacillus pasteurii DSM 23907 = CRBIP 24.76]|uniref:DUF1828 domain-containing protein n=2 Tax=Lactobacillus pasteurii TaxID=872327 RepID=I7JYA9_9LACO|nr:Putative uncharacterized protein [Lactobacillus pasteurii DSM 23907 = CRBIP 24.76]